MRILADALTGDNANTGDHNIIVRLHLCPLSRTCSFRRAFKANRDPSGSRFKLLFHSMPWPQGRRAFPRNSLHLPAFIAATRPTSSARLRTIGASGISEKGMVRGFS
ncbi:hypothetical protein D3C87_1508660 [compost metagenome]